MSALYLLHILYNVLSIKVSDNNVYMIHVHLYHSGPIRLDSLYTQITGDNSLYKILTPNITYKINYLTVIFVTCSGHCYKDNFTVTWFNTKLTLHYNQQVHITDFR